MHVGLLDLQAVLRTNRNTDSSGIFLAILGRGPKAFLIGKISDVNPEFGNFQNN